jgi:hypothetical protein
MTITQTAYDAFQKVKGLRELSQDNNMSTTRTQNAILQALDGDDLASVAALLESGEALSGARLLIAGNKMVG